VAVAVITGSLAIGDSVHNSLVKRVEDRLGRTETFIFSRYSYLDDVIIDNLSANVKGALLSNGFISVSGKLIPVMIWGLDGLEIEKGESKINTALYNEIKTAQTKDIVLRLPAAGMVPLGSMFVTDTYTKSLRLELNSVVSDEEGGNLNLKNEQIVPFNIFVNREELAETLEIEGKINLILADKKIYKEDFASAWNYKMSGLKVKKESQKTSITSERIFIQNKVVETLCKNDSTSNRIYTYLANFLAASRPPQTAHCTIPYSFITAVDYYKGKKLKLDEIILSDYAAKRLNVKIGDTISITCFISKQFKTLTEDSIFLKVGKIASLEELQGDKTLVVDFPGLSNVENCTDWNSDLPINMSLITDEDEEYWEKYKNTPKAIVPYSALAPRWANAYGSATVLQITDTNRLNNLTFEMFDIQLNYPKQVGISTAKSGVDFASLFLSLSFFIIISSGLLMVIPLSEMLFRRRNEINLLETTGFSKKRTFRLLWRESAPVVIISAMLGVVVGLIYTYLVLFLLGNVWKGATHIESFNLHPNWMKIGIGLFVGVVFSMLLVYICIVRFVCTQKIPMNSDLRIYHKKIRENPLNLCRLRASIVPFNASRLIWASIFYTIKQALLSFITLTLGVFILFSVGLNRQGFSDSSQIKSATGGFSLWCETFVPVYYNIKTEEGRAKLALKDLPNETQAIQILKQSADDASCLNLNKVITPNVLGIDMDEIINSDFKITKTIFDDNDINRFKTAGNSVYPALVDETVLLWSLGKKLGDTLLYLGENGEKASVLLAGTLQNSIFQGYILMDKNLFSEIWSEIAGSEIMLLKVPDNEIVNTKNLISQALNNYGTRVIPTGDRMKMFYSVTDTYLTIFLTLGGLGLLLGIFSFIIVVRRNLIARKKEVAMYRTLGFTEKRIYYLLYQENIIVPFYAILIGALGSLWVVVSGFSHISISTWGLAGILLFVFIFSVMVFVKSEVKRVL
jgi:putative ABC transport system permease protein